MPADFVAFAEETGLIGAIGHWVLRTACADAMSWQQMDKVMLERAIKFPAKTAGHGGDRMTPKILPDGTKICLDTEPNSSKEWIISKVDVLGGKDHFHYGGKKESGLTKDAVEWDKSHADRSADASAGVFALQANNPVALFNRAIVDTRPPFWIDIRIDGMVLLFVAGTTVVAAIVAGLIPALRASRADVASVMKDEGRSTGARSSRFSRGLAVLGLERNQRGDGTFLLGRWDEAVATFEQLPEDKLLTGTTLSLLDSVLQIALARGDGRYGRVLRSLAKTDLVVLDDWGLAPLTDEHRRDLLELLDDRHGRRATLVASQLPRDH